MQVKKFEARTMKDALEMVKKQLGPDAIILSVRDNNKSFGLVGEGSIEITAAVSEETLHKKKFAESKMRNQDIEKLQAAPARMQKDVINKFVENHLNKNKHINHQITQQRYIDIDESVSIQDEQRQAIMQSQLQNSQNRVQRQQSIDQMTEHISRQPQSQNMEIQTLKNEIETLRKVISQFQSQPSQNKNSYPGADYGIQYDLSFMFEKLTQEGISPEIVAHILTEAQEIIPPVKLKNRSLVEGWVARYILETTQISSNETNHKIHCFIGPSGSGKTTTLVKMASHLVVKENKKVALLTTDTYKVGAADQLRIFSQILNVSFAVIRQNKDWNQLLRYLPNVDCVLVDFTGLSLKSQEEINYVKECLPPASLNPRVHLVMNATTKDADMTDIGRRFSFLGYQDVIFTSLDESVQHGPIYNFMKKFDIPLHSFGIGSRVPEDYEFATKERVVDLIFKITKKTQTIQQMNESTEVHT